MKGRILLITLLMMVILVVLSAGAAGGAAQAQNRILDEAGGRQIKQLMVKFRDGVDESAMRAGASAALLDDLSRAAGEELTYVRPMSGGAHVLAINEARQPAEVRRVSARLSELPDVEYAEPDLIKEIDRRSFITPESVNITPNDTRFGDQWHYGYAPGTAEGLNLLPAWTITTGSASTIVAVIDTGILNHPDLAGKTVPGYDMISDSTAANDGDGHDNDPSDPGDWVAAEDWCSIYGTHGSSWHGTHVAGTIAAASNNGSGVAGVNWQAKILPVRVLGKCGGSTSDIIDAVRWAAGLAVPGAPANANPADVINLSLGGNGTCQASEQSAFDDAAAAGATVVIAAGNNNENAAGFSPGNCDNIITVAATDRGGDKASYSNYGSVVEVSAPGGKTYPNASNGILSTLNNGNTGPGTHNYAYYQGTSMATPHVAGLAALILGEEPAYTQAQVLAVLENNARAFLAGSSCSTSSCGAGIVDAYASLRSLNPVILYPATHLSLVVNAGEPAEVSFTSAKFSASEGAVSASLTLELSKVYGQAVSVGYVTSDGSAKSGSDYVHKNDTVTFNPGQVSKTISIDLIDNSDEEPVESFTVSLHSPSGANIVSPSTATVTIWDDDGASGGITNGDFEDQSTGWTKFSLNRLDLIRHKDDLPSTPHSGNWAAWLGGVNDEIGYLEQTVAISGGAPYLTYWHWITSNDLCGYDFAGVIINDSIVTDVYDLCESANTGGWVKHSVNLSAYAGQTVALQIRVETDGSIVSNLLVDDVVMSASPAAPAESGQFDLKPLELDWVR